ncbi:hypothetical protein AUR64_14230 [Haloprofundus marisrubri]|uniref:Uncharacterized protein n=1 Tax=Haloprofundus marisrubri TaxID=1514971 RepID=A0A0W1R783_9EURY|nr:hypothetical protein [Haloprofundus marisrubri]KTG08962.1 hypothetical protein AUR64_14230 [Haloprofundus marisrubri]
MSERTEWLAEQMRHADPSDQYSVLLTALQDETGDSLRTVAYGNFESREYNLLYADAETIQQYSAADIDAIVDDLALEQLAAERQTELYEPIGDLELTIRVFEEGINVLARGSETTPMLFVGLDGDERNLLPTISILRTFLGERRPVVDGEVDDRDDGEGKNNGQDDEEDERRLAGND